MKSFRIPAFLQAVLVIAAAYLAFKFGFPPLLPQTLMIQYMIIAIIGVLLYFSFDDERWAEFQAPVLATLRNDNLVVVRWAFLIIIPLIVGYTVYGMVKPSSDAPVEPRQVHPAPPASVKVFGKSFDLATLENPIREEILETLAGEKEAGWEKYQTAVSAGRDVYYQNCFYCHGDLLDGQGHYGTGFNPQPINFQDPTIIPQLQESFLFWRITTGGPGLPKEGRPWNSAMPVWHEMLSEQDVWNVITFIFDYNGQVPRIWDPEISRVVTGMKDEVQAERREIKGQDLYKFRCEVCHGEQGAGDGVAAELMYPKPRDFTLALFKYKTSPGTLLPLDDDLFNTIKNGLTGTGMPGWASLMSDEQIRSLIPVIKGFDITAAWAPDDAEDESFDDDGHYIKTDFRQVAEVEPEEGQIPYSEESVAKGRDAFLKSCKECHGEAGRGNIVSGKKLEDDWGFRIWPRDLTKPWTWRATQSTDSAEKERDATVKAIYTRLSIGIPGTPMPAHRAVEEGNKDPVSLEDRWHISNFVYSLRDTAVQPKDGAVVTGTKVSGGVPTSLDDERWNGADAVTLSLVPNIIKEERLFTPLNDAVTVRAIYNEKEIAFLLEVDDRTESRPGIEYFTDLQDENKEMHADAVAIQFPMEAAYMSSPMVEKPLYRHGDKRHHTTIWYWNAGSVEPKRDAGAVLMEGVGPNKRPKLRESDGTFSAGGEWKDGKWRVIMTRPRSGGAIGDIDFVEGQFMPISFANWDGSNGEVGSKHTLSPWYWLFLPPEFDYQRVYGLPAGIALLVFLAGLMLVRSEQKKVKG
ncbi:MAG: c-type cytochrome [gamma proteobacterium endosymbiont of Lamellibrachia anaximandri]|nr:c-type cytochrome [gamma proteobacterium endosymbiont of Lamellibrachia anaximandri]MBL3533547.1 c-type cytochrome [gamma proteobacterium endosymbiont of Lamellibrachia anaximandri]